MNQNKLNKVNEVNEIKSKLQAAKALVVVEYSGIKVKELQSLRKELKVHNVELKVYKNRLFKIASKEAGFAELNDNLTLQNAYAFGMDDDIAPAKVLANFAKTNENLKLKTGIYEGKVIDSKTLDLIASLPSYEGAIGILAMQLISPIRYLGFGLNKLVTEGKIKE